MRAPRAFQLLACLAMAIAVSACAEAAQMGALDGALDTPDAGDGAAPEAMIDAASPTEPPAYIGTARRAFDELVQQHGDRYWYEAESCNVRLASGGSVFVVVENGVASVVSHRIYPRSECEHFVNNSIGNGTFPQLLEGCAALSSPPRGPSRVSLDPNGMVVTCYTTESPGIDCSEACGRGYHIRRWGFGSLPGSWAPYDDAGAKCVSHSATWRLLDTRDAAVESPSYSLGPCRNVTTTAADGGSDCRTLSSDLVDALELPLGSAWRWSGDIDAGTKRDPTFGEVVDVELKTPSPAPAQRFRIGTECASGFSCDPLPLNEQLRALLKRISTEYEAHPRCSVTP